MRGNALLRSDSAYNVVMTLIFLIGATFLFAIGLLFLRRKAHLQKFGRELSGKIIGYIRQKSRGSSSQQGGTTYHPIIEYTLNGEEYLITCGGTNSFPYRIGERVKILSLPHGPEYAMLKGAKSDNLFIGVFFFMGLIFGGVFHFTYEWSLSTKGGLYFVLLILAYLAPIILERKMKKHKATGPLWLKSARIRKRSELEKLDVYWSNSELDTYHRKVNKLDAFISKAFAFICYSALVMMWNLVDFKNKEKMRELAQNFGPMEEFVELIKEKDPMVIGFLIALFFALMSTHSLIYSLRKRARN